MRAVAEARERCASARPGGARGHELVGALDEELEARVGEDAVQLVVGALGRELGEGVEGGADVDRGEQPDVLPGDLEHLERWKTSGPQGLSEAAVGNRRRIGENHGGHFSQ